MHDVVAVEVALADGAKRYFVTWGRIHDAVDPTALQDLVLRHAPGFSLGGAPVSARVCATLREAAESPSAPYFFECYFDFCTRPIPYGPGYQAWRQAMREAMDRGEQIGYCGRPAAPP